MDSSPKVEIINIGNELLNGIRENGHLVYLGRQLSERGIEVRRNTVIPDEREEIAHSFRRSWNDSDVVITTGGLEPTHNGFARETLARVTGADLEFSESVQSSLQDHLRKEGRNMTEDHRKQCYVPKGAELLWDSRAVSPGFYLRRQGKLLITLPSSSPQLNLIWEREVLPRLGRDGLLGLAEPALQLRAAGIGRNALEEALRPILQQWPGLKATYQFQPEIIDLRLSADPGCLSFDQVQEAGKSCCIALGENFVCFGAYSLAKVVFDHLRIFEKTLAVAESCTGGLLSDSFTNIPGASKTFIGSVVCYNNDAKIQMLEVPECILDQHGAVSAECAAAMATGAAERFGADYGLSISGYADPAAGMSPHPSGTIFFGYFSPVGVWSRKLVFPGNRTAVKEGAVNGALDWMRRKLWKYRVEDFLASIRESR